MNKKIAKLLALGMSIAMVFSLAACGDDTADEPSTEAPTTTEATTEAPAVPATGESESVSESESGEPASTEAPGVPTDKAGIVNLFNSAVDKISSTSATYDRTLNESGGIIKAPLGITLEFTNGGEENPQWNYDVLSGNFNKTGETLPADKTVFSKISDGDVASASSTDNGDTITLDITLNSKSVTQSGGGANEGLGSGGYMYFVNFQETSELFNAVIGGPKYNYETKTGGFAFPGEATLVDATFAMSNGKLNATIDKASGKLTKATLSFAETLDINAKYMGDTTAHFGGSGTLYYSFS